MEQPVERVVREKKTKILHFSDGIEEVTDDSDGVDGLDEGPPSGEHPEIDEVRCLIQMARNPQNQSFLLLQSTMQWMPWLLLKSKRTGETILSGCDYMGEFLASALGITSPKFIDGEAELQKAAAEQRELDEEAAEEIREMRTWSVDTQSTTTTITEPSSPVLIMNDEVAEAMERKKSERY